MSRAAVTRLSGGAPFEACLERAAPRRAHGVDRLLAEKTGWLATRALWLGGQARVAFGRRVLAMCEQLAALDEASLDHHVGLAQARLREAGPLGDALTEGLSAVCEVSRRCLGKLPYPVQVAATRELLRGRIVEMSTGEGKSLTAAMTAAVLASAGVPVDIFTVNDYLARRDAGLMRPLFDRLGLSVAAVDGPPESAQRRAAYAADVLYVVNKDYVFDYLRHRQAARSDPFAGRGLFFAIVDEADSILIDEARTPLILARERGTESVDELTALLALGRSLVPATDFSVSPRERKADLLGPGRERLNMFLDRKVQAPAGPRQMHEERLEQALCALHFYRLDRDYVIRDGKVQIVDEYTGRILADRTWQRGLQQLIEIKEGLPPTAARETIASLTYPQFFRKYLRMAGMSGTVVETAGELRRNYGAQVVSVPTHRPVRRERRGPFVHVRSAERWDAVVEAARGGLCEGRAVLIGTRSVQASEVIGDRLMAASIDHVVLNARNDAAEAVIVAEAGSSRRVTVATNMAGRGTDILIDETVRLAGGLLVILTEFHESTRVDRQLFGRCARQGDPGLALAFASLEDDLFVKYLHPAAAYAARRLAATMSYGKALPAWFAQRLVASAQRRASAHQRIDRDANLAHDDALRDQLGFIGDLP